jgi:hypothetical protein
MPRLIAVLLSLCAVGASAATPDEDTDAYLRIFQGDSRVHNLAVQDLGWKGISDTRLFDLLEQRVLSEQQAARSARAEKDRIEHYIRALGFSGQRKYRPTISRFGLDADYIFRGPRVADRRSTRSGTGHWRAPPRLEGERRREPRQEQLRSDDCRAGSARSAYFAVKDDAVVDLPPRA